MENFCFVVMPFGGQFDEIYRRIYQPAIKTAGLKSLRADDIYDNQPIMQDIKQSIQNATLILADVTGRNANVNYELGIAHGLGKEVIIVTSNQNDVPSDYRHLRYLNYNPTGIDWSQKLLEDLSRTLKNVLARLHRANRQRQLENIGYIEEDTLLPYLDSFGSCYDDPDEIVIRRAKKLGYNCIKDTHTPSHALLCYYESNVMLDRREGAITEWDSAAACLLTEKVFRFNDRLPHNNLLRMRSVFFDLYDSHGFNVDYFYNQGCLPAYTAQEILREVNSDFYGQFFEGCIRYIEENFEHDRFNVDSDQYYDYYKSSSSILQYKNNAVCLRDGFYVADIIQTASSKNGKHYFYMLDGLLPLSELGAPAYISGESHWLADWNQDAPRFTVGETIKFKIIKVRELKNWDHVSNARNIDFVI